MKKNGFTLVEVIVVCVIIALLFSIAVPSFANYIESNQAKECQVNRKSLMALWETAKVKDPSTTMEEMLTSEAGRKITCPSGGTYSVTGHSLTCSIVSHGSDALAEDSVASADKIPGREETPEAPTATPEATPTGTPTPTVSITPTDTPSPTVSPSVTSTPEPSSTPEPVKTPQQILLEMSGSWDEVYQRASQDDDFEIKRGEVYTQGGVYAVVEDEEIDDDDNLGKKQNMNSFYSSGNSSPMIKMNMETIYLSTDHSNNKTKYKRGDVYYDKDTGTFYVCRKSASIMNQASKPPNSSWWIKVKSNSLNNG